MMFRTVLLLLLVIHSTNILASRSELLKFRFVVPKPEDIKKNSNRPTPGSIVYPSIFPEVIPPYVNFSLCTDHSSRKVPEEVKKYLIWIQSLKRVNQVVQNTGLRLVGRKDSESEWFGFFNAKASNRRTPTAVLKHPYQKYNILPGAEELCNKDKLWYNVQRFVKKFGTSKKNEFDFLLETYVFPDEIFQFLKRLTFRCTDEKADELEWLYKPTTSAMSNGFFVFPNQLPPFYPRRNSKRGIIQRFMSDPYGGFFIRYRLYVLQTGVHPLRVYVFKKGETMLKQSAWSWLDVYIENDDLLNVLALEGHDPVKIQDQMEDAILKSLFAAERKMADKSRSQLNNSYNAYQLWSADFMFDKFGTPWLNEFNRYVSFWIHYDAQYHIKVPLITETLNVAGYHFPPTMSQEARDFVERELPLPLPPQTQKSRHCQIVFNDKLYSFDRSEKTKTKAKKYSDMFGMNRRNYLNTILDDLEGDEVRELMIAEDELSRTQNYKRIFPTNTTYEYFRFLESSDPYPYMLQDAWENKYGHNRTLGIEFLRSQLSKINQGGVLNYKQKLLKF